MADGNFAQAMQFPAPDPLEADFAAEKQIQLTRKRAFRPTRPPGYRFHQSVLFSEPVHNQAGIRQPGEADECGLRRLHPAILGTKAVNAMVKRIKKFLKNAGAGCV
jgi:hypothetical protein